MADPEHPPLPPRYLPLTLLGAGGFGTVHRCRDAELGREVAVKVLSVSLAAGEARARFAREAKATAAIEHPHVVRIFDSGILPNGAPFLVYELVEGPDLWARLAGGVRAAFPELLAWGRALAGALDAVHAAGLVHRDVKPENVLLRGGTNPVLCDFGLALRPGGETVRTAEGLILGTPAFMAPELFSGLPATPASDQYALAATLHWCRTGRLVLGEDLAGILAALARPPAWELTNFDAAPFRRALDRDPARRFPSCRDFVEALAGDPVRAAPTLVLAPTGPPAPAPRLPPAPPRLGSRALLPGLAALLAAGLLARGLPRRAPPPDLPSPTGAEPSGPDLAAESARLGAAVDRLGDLVARLAAEPKTAPRFARMRTEGTNQRWIPLEGPVADGLYRVANALAGYLEAARAIVPPTPGAQRDLLAGEAFEALVGKRVVPLLDRVFGELQALDLSERLAQLDRAVDHDDLARSLATRFGEVFAPTSWASPTPPAWLGMRARILRHHASFPLDPALEELLAIFEAGVRPEEAGHVWVGLKLLTKLGFDRRGLGEEGPRPACAALAARLDRILAAAARGFPRLPVEVQLDLVATILLQEERSRDLCSRSSGPAECAGRLLPLARQLLAGNSYLSAGMKAPLDAALAVVVRTPPEPNPEVGALASTLAALRGLVRSE